MALESMKLCCHFIGSNVKKYYIQFQLQDYYSLPRTVSSFFGVQRTDNAGCAHKTIGQRTNVLN